jgi:DNA polymerase III alpha subunit
MPQEYQDLDVGRWLLGQCDTDQERQRVEQELTIYDQYQMTMLLNYLKYLVDTMRSNNIVWGVGRGSSVASYCLYLIGVHKIDSLAFDLDIHEFLK